jgi:hypothetical protein
MVDKIKVICTTATDSRMKSMLRWAVHVARIERQETHLAVVVVLQFTHRKMFGW